MVDFVIKYYLLAWFAQTKKGATASGSQLLAVAIIRAALFIAFFIGLVLFVGYHLIFIDHSYEGDDNV